MDVNNEEDDDDELVVLRQEVVCTPFSRSSERLYSVYEVPATPSQVIDTLPRVW